MSTLKMNTFHWHLTEDQGWRIEIKKYPKLQEIAAYRNETLIGHYSDQPHQFDEIKYGGYYTQEQIKEMDQEKPIFDTLVLTSAQNELCKDMLKKTVSNSLSEDMKNILRKINEMKEPLSNSSDINYSNMEYEEVRPIFEALISQGLIEYDNTVDGNNLGKMYLNVKVTTLGKSLLK
jgi:hypothetical protein